MCARGIAYCVALLWPLAVAAGEARRSPTLLGLEPNLWHKLHEQKAGDAVRFQRQEHGGACFDTRRGQIVLFGSNTHGRDWTNSPLLFDPVACTWSRVYPDDDPKTYTVNPEGLPVAGEKGDHPWATHTFGALVYDPERDEVVVACYPAHMVPGRFTNALKGTWEKVKRHPTWTFDVEKKEWRPLPCKAEHFFPHCAAWDSDRKVVIGYRPDGVFELLSGSDLKLPISPPSADPLIGNLRSDPGREWKRVAPKGYFGWHTAAAYDARNKALVVFGSNENANDVVAWWPATGEHKKMPTPGQRPPKDQHTPMCFDPEAGRTVVLVDHRLDEADPKKVQTETWLYDLAADAWTPVPTATLPFGCGMNYNLVYDPGHRACLLVTGTYGQPTAVWALKIQ